MAWQDIFRIGGAGVVQDIEAIARTGEVTPRTTAPRVSAVAPSEPRDRVVRALGDIRERITTGYRVGREEPVDISRITPEKEVKPFREYVTAPIYQTATKLAADYQRWLSKQKGIVEIPEGPGGEVVEPLARFGRGVLRTPSILVETAGMVPLGVEYIAREPELAAVGVPVGLGVMAGGLEVGIRERPYETAGELVGMALGPKIIGKVSPIKPTVVKIPVKPTARTTYMPKVPAEMITYRGLYAQVPLAKPRPLVGAVGVRPAVGAPRIEVAPGYMPITKIETAVALPSIKARLTPTEAVRLETGIKLMEQLAKEKPQAKVPLDVGEVKYVPEKARPIVERWLQARDSVVYGSATQKVQMLKGRIPKDIDVAVKNPMKSATELESQLKTVLGDNVRRRGTTIEVYEKGSWHHAVDIHPMEHIKGLLEYGFETQPPIRIAGQRYMRIGEQLTRKGRSILTPWERRVDPVAHRMKDIPDFMNIAQSLIESKRASAESAFLLKKHKMRKALEAERLLIKFKETREIPEIPLKPITPPPKRAAIVEKPPWVKDVIPTKPKEIIEKPMVPTELIPKEYPYKPTAPAKKITPVYPITPKIKPSRIELYPIIEKPPTKVVYPVPVVPKIERVVGIPYTSPYAPEKPDEYLPPITPPYKPTVYPPPTPPYAPPAYPPYKAPPYVPPEAPVYRLPPVTPPPTTKPPLEPKKAKPKKKISYEDPRYWPVENPVAGLWEMLGVKK